MVKPKIETKDFGCETELNVIDELNLSSFVLNITNKIDFIDLVNQTAIEPQISTDDTFLNDT